MAVKFTYTFIASTMTALVTGVIFYLLASERSAVSSEYTLNDTYMGMLFVFVLSLIIGLTLWPGVLEKRV